MSKDLKKLKSLGAQKIHEDTHIALRYVQSVIYESFEGLTKVQFLGFISILEREYQLDLSLLKIKGLEYFEDDASHGKVFVVPEKKTNFAALYIIIVIVIFSLAIYESFDFTKTNLGTKALDNHAIVDAQKKISVNQEIDVLDEDISDENLTAVISELNTSIETNSSSEPENVIADKKEPEVATLFVLPEVKVDKTLSSIVIEPRVRVWIGYINKTDNKKTQAIVNKILTLDGTKEWLIVAGHGSIDITVNGEKTKYSSPKSVRYRYKDGILKELNIQEFKELNNGRLW